MTRPLWLSLNLVLLGCGADSRNDVFSDGDAPPGLPVEVEAEPAFVVGVREGDPHEEFDEISTPFLLPDGSLVVPSAGHGELRIFDGRGGFLTVLGGSGEGPGEFGRLGAAWPRGDTIEAVDLALQRITRFLPTGEVQVIRLDGPPVMLSAGPLSDGWILVNIIEPGLRRDNPRDQWVVYRYDLEGRYVNDVTGVEGMRRIRMPGMNAVKMFSPSARFDVHNDEIYVAETLMPAIDVLDRNGSLVRRIAWEPETITTPADARDQVRNALQNGVEGSGPFTEALLNAPLPNSIPLFTDLLVDEEGFVWVRPYVPARDAVVVGGTPASHRTNPGGEWYVFDGSGEEVGSIVLPSDLAPYQITSQAVVGIARDELGIETVRVHALTRR